MESVNFGINKGKKLSVQPLRNTNTNTSTDNWLFLIFHYIVISILFHNNIHSCNIHNNNCGHSPNIKKSLLGKYELGILILWDSQIQKAKNRVQHRHHQLWNLKSHQIWHQTSSFFFIIIADLHLTMTLLKIMITKFHLVIWYPKLDLKSLLIVSLHFLQWICNHITVITAITEIVIIIVIVIEITNNILIHSYTINTCSHNSRDLLRWDLNFINTLILKKDKYEKIAYLFMEIFIMNYDY